MSDCFVTFILESQIWSIKPRPWLILVSDTQPLLESKINGDGGTCKIDFMVVINSW